MIEYFDIINVMDVISIVENKKTIDELKNEKLQQYYYHCQTEEERKEATQFIEEAFSFITPFLEELSLEEFDVIAKYGQKICTSSYSINDALRKKTPLSLEDEKLINILDNIINKLKLNEEVTVYRALKPCDTFHLEYPDAGYMSTSLTNKNHFINSPDHEIILEITLPIGTNCVYAEWFKGSDEKELLLGRGTSLSIESERKELINGNIKTIYSCRVKQNSLDKTTNYQTL